MAEEEEVKTGDASEVTANEDQAQANQSESAETVSATSKKKKVSQMSLDEIEKRITTVKSKMGGLGSRYAKQLLRHKEALSQ